MNIIAAIKNIFSAIGQFFQWLRERRLVELGRMKQKEEERRKREKAREVAEKIWRGENRGRFKE